MRSFNFKENKERQSNMFSKLFSIETKPGAFFRRIDWTAFWGATLIAFLVYFFTLGPSVGLEDSGELATAADHLGVPHPPGYPFWSLCCWIFCRVFSWVTYMGQPTPAWAVSLFSAVAGAFAAGCTAMLICRSGSDMLDSIPSGDADGEGAGESRAQKNALMSLAGGLGGSLVFAFSPVEWSQSTIVEIYSLNALFLMAVFLLSYRWMRRPSDKILWLTAFVFGLGLTNYQVLLLAAVPLAIIIALRDIRLFRDFVLVLIPMGLTAKLLQIGSMLRATSRMSGDVINKFEPIVKQLPADRPVPNELFPSPVACPNEILLWLGLALVVAAPVAGVLARRRLGSRNARSIVFGVGGAGAALVFFAATVFSGVTTWSGQLESAVAPLITPTKYAVLGAILAASFVAAVGAVFTDDEERDLSSKMLLASGALALVAVIYAVLTTGFEYSPAVRRVVAVASAGDMGYGSVPGHEVFSWLKPTLILVVGIAALFALTVGTPRGLAYAIPVAAVQISAFVLLRKGAMNGLTDPHSWWFFWPLVWNFAILALAAVTLPNGRSVSLAALFAELGVSFYAYMPIVSDLRNPPMNWGYPRTWAGFKHALMRGQYEAIKMPDFFSKAGISLFMKQLGFYFQDLRMQFTLVAAALALVPFALWKATVRTADRARPVIVHAAWVAAGLYVAAAGLVTLFSEVLDGEVPLRLDKLLLLLLAILALAGLVAMCARQAVVVKRMVMREKPDEGESDDAPVSFRFLADDVSQQWLIAVGACFALMSLFLVALAGVKGDIQDGFIQKVKFISSHGMFSLWIGYGLAVGLVVANRLAKMVFANNDFAQRAVFYALCAAAACVALIPIYENYTNDRLVFAMGSAEQNGHTFGWQFGNYQLRGANAIREELSPDEEPLPNPLWPEEMEPSSIFFGGTDPGRFVPTYMSYSADVREDVFLITQNALADDTYMSVMRDLYGDRIWIPAIEDSAAAFSEYVTSLTPEERAAKGVVEANGRVQVTGALSVMDINSILTRKMFEHERLRHAFYVEESYVIQWMYPYLAPHGLIMKIHRDRNPLNATIVKNDMDFWDWYHRRLLRDPAFRRDFPAQKSFSKLRAAIAGLYANNGLYSMADQAFREAVLLYPASPEATFRYIQEVQLPSRRWNAVNDLLDFTDRVDPNNKRTEGLRDHIKRFSALSDRVSALNAKAAKGELGARDGIDLAQCQMSMGQKSLAVATLRKALAKPDAEQFDHLYLAAHVLSACGERGDAAAAMKRALGHIPAKLDPRDLRSIAAILMNGGLNAEAETVLNELLRLDPKDVRTWIDIALVKDALGQTRAAQGALRSALQYDREGTAARISSDARLQKIAEPFLMKR